MDNTSFGVTLFLSFLAVILLFITGFGFQFFKVFSAEMSGKAELAQAESNRQIKVREAEAERDAATLLAEAEILRAGGVAEANTIIADGLGGPDGYLRYLYIDMLQDAKEKQIVYIPTEAGLPILEANPNWR
jgi:regulator of protease activity HflC (stomatin/prohibitin superfamily)